MRVVQDPAELSAATGGVFVPTMGALHEGHLALMRRARPMATPLVVSIFVNPTQFGPGEDLQRYPRTLEADLEAARTVGVDVVFAPDVGTMYPSDVEIPVPTLPDAATRPGLEDAHRPGHFAGVCQVVARLFDLVRPSLAIFGEKDYQQLLVIRRMVDDLKMRIRIVPVATVREADGLAMSSRNGYLNEAERAVAPVLHRTLCAVRDALAAGASDQAALEAEAEAALARAGFRPDYVRIRRQCDLEPPEDGDALIVLGAAFLGAARLIDNLRI